MPRRCERSSAMDEGGGHQTALPVHSKKDEERHGEGGGVAAATSVGAAGRTPSIRRQNMVEEPFVAPPAKKVDDAAPPARNTDGVALPIGLVDPAPPAGRTLPIQRQDVAPLAKNEDDGAPPAPNSDDVALPTELVHRAPPSFLPPELPGASIHHASLPRLVPIHVPFNNNQEQDVQQHQHSTPSLYYTAQAQQSIGAQWMPSLYYTAQESIGAQWMPSLYYTAQQNMGPQGMPSPTQQHNIRMPSLYLSAQQQNLPQWMSGPNSAQQHDIQHQNQYPWMSRHHAAQQQWVSNHNSAQQPNTQHQNQAQWICHQSAQQQNIQSSSQTVHAPRSTQLQKQYILSGALRMLSSAPLSSQSHQVTDVWADNAITVFGHISERVKKCSGILIAGLDSEFAIPDQAAVSDGEPSTPECFYRQLCNMVNGGNLVQVGLALVTADDPVVRVWQFNLHFSAAWRAPWHPGVAFLRHKARLNLEDHASRGIPGDQFSNWLKASGLLCNPNIAWVTFAGCNDLGFISHYVSRAELPQDRQSFFRICRQLFPQSYDLRIFTKLGKCRDEAIDGGLSKVCQKLEVNIPGHAHHSGYDALCTVLCLAKMAVADAQFLPRIDKYCGALYGVSDISRYDPN